MRNKYHEHFERRERKDGVNFYCLKDGAPEDLRDFIHHVHDDHFSTGFPNDWIYDTIHTAFLDLCNDGLEDINIEPDIYNKDLVEWLHNGFAAGFCNEAMEEELCTKKCLWEIVGSGQWLAKTRIYEAVNEFINEEKE